MEAVFIGTSAIQNFSVAGILPAYISGRKVLLFRKQRRHRRTSGLSVFELCQMERVGSLLVKLEPDAIGFGEKYFYNTRIELPP